MRTTHRNLARLLCPPRARYAIPVQQVREVLRVDCLIRVPGAPACIWGIVNVRGAVVTVTDLAAMLGGVRADSLGSVVLLSRGARCIGLAVDSVLEVERVDAETHGAPEVLGSVGTQLLDAVALSAAHVHTSEEMAW